MFKYLSQCLVQRKDFKDETEQCYCLKDLKLSIIANSVVPANPGWHAQAQNPMGPNYEPDSCTGRPCMGQHTLALEGTYRIHLEFFIQHHYWARYQRWTLGAVMSCIALSLKRDTVQWKKQVKITKIDCAKCPERKRHVTRTLKMCSLLPSASKKSFGNFPEEMLLL